MRQIDRTRRPGNADWQGSGSAGSGLLRALVGTALVLAVVSLGALRPAQAHPHVWVAFETTVVFEKGAIVGFRHKWTFDELYTAMAIEGLDKNNDGIYSREELAELAKVNVESLKEYDYFTVVRLAGQPLKTGAPTDFWLEHSAPAATPASAPGAASGRRGPTDKKGTMDRFWNWMAGGESGEAAGADRKGPPAKVLALHFFVPLEQPVLAEAEGFTFEVSDPTFFIAFTPAPGDPIKISEGAPAGCRATMNAASADDGRRLGEGNAVIPEGGIAFINSQAISVLCKG